jgi:hypothetical protein
MQRIDLKLTARGVGMKEKQVTNLESPREVSKSKYFSLLLVGVGLSPL